MQALPLLNTSADINRSPATASCSLGKPCPPSSHSVSWASPDNQLLHHTHSPHTSPHTLPVSHILLQVASVVNVISSCYFNTRDWTQGLAYAVQTLLPS